jgi:ubiquinone/menaquinone biosynthesis C-methylase UbiE
LTLELSQEAGHIICEFAEEVGRKIDELGFEIDARRRTEIISDIKIYFQFHSIKLAGRRGAHLVDAVDVKNALKRVNPTRVVEHALVDPPMFRRMEDQRLRHLNLLRNRLQSYEKPALLDAGCGWGRQLIEYRRFGLNTKYVAFDIDKAAIRLGKKIEPSIDFLVADIQKIPFKSDSFDVVICNAVVNFIEKQGVYNTIREFKHVLKPRGFLSLYALFTKNHLWTSALNLLSSVFQRILPKGGVFSFYTLKQIHRLLSENEFTEIRMEKGFLTIIPCPFGSSEMVTAIMGR